MAEKKKKTEGGLASPKRSGGGYTASDITVLEGLEAVRRRPGMYIGTTSEDGLHHLVIELINNCIDESMAGFGNLITITLLPDDVVSVSDEGRGIPVDIHKDTKVSALETVLTTLHAGGKFGGGGYKVSGGLHGVGVSIVNALSLWTRAEVKRDGELWMQEYKRGKPVAKVKAVKSVKGTGTTITFQPDAEIFTATTTFSFDKILDYCRQQAYLNKGVRIRVIDEREPITYKEGEKKITIPGRTHEFYFEGGVVSYVKHHLMSGKEAKNLTPFYIEKTAEKVLVEISLQYSDDYNEVVAAFANNILNPEGGMHVQGFRTALTRTLNNYARSQNLLKEKDANLTGEDVREGLNAVVSVKLENPQFEGQTKAKLGSVEARTAVESVFSEAFAVYLEEHPKDGAAIVEKCVISAKARAAARAARDTVLRKGMLEGLTLPGKLADCSSRNPEECELFVVEGDSAGGSAKQGRNREFQAILPLRGKPVNVEKARLDKIIASPSLKPLIIALGTSIGETFSIEKLRYHRIIIMADADVDGSHIATILLTFFFRHFRPLIDNGHVYIAQPPLYLIQKGKEKLYAYNEEQKEDILKRLSEQEAHNKKSGKIAAKQTEEKEKSAMEDDENPLPEEENHEQQKINGVSIQRYKGLGEMNPEQLSETTLDPKNRVLKQITIEDALKAEEIFELLMGNDVPPRRRFILSNARNVKNLDT